MPESRLLSVVLLSYYSGSRIARAYGRLSALLDREGIPFELVVMDDGSKDDSFAQAQALAASEPRVRAYSLSRNYGSPCSALASCSVVRGACMTFIPDDEQQPYDTIVQAYRLWEQGHKLIFPCRKKRAERGVGAWCSKSYYRLMNALSDVSFPPGGCDTVFFDRELIEIVNTRLSHRNTSIIPELLRLGYDPVFLPYERPLGLNEGKSRWTLRKKIRLTVDTFLSSSSVPIKLITAMGFSFSALALLAIPFYAYIALFGNQHFWGVRVPGWTSLLVALCFFSGLILFSLGIIAEYIYRIFDEVKHRPAWIIRNADRQP